uniref:Uncharacterized protein n=1 Tax=Pipistrellus kuhlii TaxID=59472 RepID=A0A7J7XUY7_PIPKU|nr:hypothetical protein mPipKuh1_010468 [Pipistrellus kuhlii]
MSGHLAGSGPDGWSTTVMCSPQLGCPRPGGGSGWNPVCACQVPSLILRTAVEPTPPLRLQGLGWAQQVRVRPPWLGFTGKGRGILFRVRQNHFSYSQCYFQLAVEKPCFPTGHIYTNSFLS